MQRASTSFMPISVDSHAKRNLFVHVGKSEATVTNNKKTNNALEVLHC